jgi:hypothetical protein
MCYEYYAAFKVEFVQTVYSFFFAAVETRRSRESTIGRPTKIIQGTSVIVNRNVLAYSGSIDNGSLKK